MPKLHLFREKLDKDFQAISVGTDENGSATAAEIPYRTIEEALTTRDANLFIPKTIERTPHQYIYIFLITMSSKMNNIRRMSIII